MSHTHIFTSPTRCTPTHTTHKTHSHPHTTCKCTVSTKHIPHTTRQTHTLTSPTTHTLTPHTTHTLTPPTRYTLTPPTRYTLSHPHHTHPHTTHQIHTLTPPTTHTLTPPTRCLCSLGSNLFLIMAW